MTFGYWVARDLIKKNGLNLYKIKSTVLFTDILGAWADGSFGKSSKLSELGHSDFAGNKPYGPFDYTAEDKDKETEPFNPKSTWRHFRPLQDSEKDLTLALKRCDNFEIKVKTKADEIVSNYPTGHLWGSIQGLFPEMPEPDNPEYYSDAFKQAKERSVMWFELWNKCCVCKNEVWIQRVTDNGRPVCENLRQPNNPYGEKSKAPTIPRKNRRPPHNCPSALKGFHIYY